MSRRNSPALRAVEPPLQGVREISSPFGRARAKGVKALGLQYERAFGKACGAQHGPWLEWEDAAGRGICQPDWLLRGVARTLVIETKLSWVSEAQEKLDRLYLPLIGAFHKRGTLGLVVCKNLRPEIPSSVAVVGDLRSAITVLLAGKQAVWQWRGEAVLASAA